MTARNKNLTLVETRSGVFFLLEAIVAVLQALCSYRYLNTSVESSGAYVTNGRCAVPDGAALVQTRNCPHCRSKQHGACHYRINFRLFFVLPCPPPSSLPLASPRGRPLIHEADEKCFQGGSFSQMLGSTEQLQPPLHTTTNKGSLRGRRPSVLAESPPDNVSTSSSSAVVVDTLEQTPREPGLVEGETENMEVSRFGNASQSKNKDDGRADTPKETLLVREAGGRRSVCPATTAT